jgi:DNA-binding transcriptional ArsR family regulator
MRPKSPVIEVARYAEMLTVLGTEARLRIMRLLLSAHPDGLVVGDIQKELGLTASNLSHHLEKLKNEELVKVRRDGRFLWCSANADVLRDLLAFRYSECCTRNRILDPDAVVHIKN